MLAESSPLAIVPTPEAVHHQGGGAIANQFYIAAGMVLAQHRHSYDHLSILASGRIELDIDGKRSEHEGPCCLLIKADTHHGVKALTDVVWYCIHAESDAEAEADLIEQDRSAMVDVVRRLTQ